MGVHSQYTGLELHQPYHFIQESDPGAVGAGLFWLQISTGSVSRRSNDNTMWVGIGGTATPPLTTKGDVYVYGSGPTRLPVGTNGQILIADSTQTLGVKWGTNTNTLPGWLSNSPDNYPSSPNALDDEFTTSATLPGGGSAKWTWRNQASATVGQLEDAIQLLAPALTGDSLGCLEQNAPSNPWEFTTKVTPQIKNGVPVNAVVGLYALDTSDSNKMVLTAYQFVGSGDGGNACQMYFNSPTSYHSVSNAIQYFYGAIYLKLKDDGTNFTFSYSREGRFFNTLATLSRTAWLAGSADKVGICCSSEQNTYSVSGVFEWFRRTL